MKGDEVVDGLKIVLYLNLFFFLREHIFQLNQLIYRQSWLC